MLEANKVKSSTTPKKISIRFSKEGKNLLFFKILNSRKL
jgi:hypothetical protein